MPRTAPFVAANDILLGGPGLSAPWLGVPLSGSDPADTAICESFGTELRLTQGLLCRSRAASLCPDGMRARKVGTRYIPWSSPVTANYERILAGVPEAKLIP